MVWTDAQELQRSLVCNIKLFIKHQATSRSLRLANLIPVTSIHKVQFARRNHQQPEKPSVQLGSWKPAFNGSLPYLRMWLPHASWYTRMWMQGVLGLRSQEVEWEGSKSGVLKWDLLQCPQKQLVWNIKHRRGKTPAAAKGEPLRRVHLSHKHLQLAPGIKQRI